MTPNLTNPGHFGSAVIGEEAAKAERLVVEKGANIFGKLVVDDAEAVAVGTAAHAAQELNPQSVPELIASLKEHPDAFDALLDAEFLRQEGPRKSALRHFLKTEDVGEGPTAAPRGDVIERIKRGLAEAAS